MSNRRGGASIAANPVLIGAATTLVLVVAVFLAYNANSGLPFVPTYTLNAQVPSAANLVVGNEVRIGGARVGVVSNIKPVAHRNGSVTASLEMKLETSVKPLPKDSTLVIRPKSALGLKYVEVTRGTSRDGFADGAKIPIANQTPKAVEFDEVLSTFDTKTRAAQQVNFTEFGNALAGRGQDLNNAITSLNPLLRNLQPVMQNLADPRARLNHLFVALGQAASEVAPVAGQQADLFVKLDTTMNALSAVARPYIQDTITGGPPALDAATRGFPRQRPFIANAARLFADLRPGVRSLRRFAPTIADALQVGTPVLRRTVQFNKRLKPTFQSLQSFALDPMVKLGVNDLTKTARLANPTLASLAPTQMKCNYVTLWFRNIASLLSQGDNNGTGQRFIIIATPQGPNSEGTPSAKPAAGPNQDNYLHSDPYPNTAVPGETQECEAANETYLPGQVVTSNVPGNQGLNHDETVRDLTQ